MKGITQSIVFFFRHIYRSKSFWVTVGGIVVMFLLTWGISASVFNNIPPGTKEGKVVTAYDMTSVNLLNGMAQLMVYIGLFAAALNVNSVVKRGVLDLFLSLPVRRWELLTGAFIAGILFELAVLAIVISGSWLIHSSVFGIYYGENLHWGLLNLLGFVVMFHLVLFLSFGFRSPIAGLLVAIAYAVVVSPILFVARELTSTSGNAVLRETVNTLYWILPKSAELANPFFMSSQPLPEGHILKLILSTIFFIFTVFGLTIIVFEKKDH